MDDDRATKTAADDDRTLADQVEEATGVPVDPPPPGSPEDDAHLAQRLEPPVPG